MQIGHIFSDESEATQGGHLHHLLVAAVAICPGLAKSLMNRFRKRTGLQGEIKGHSLSIEHRQKFFDLMAEFCPEATVVMVCDRTNPLSGMMMRRRSPGDLWADLTTEACLALKPDGKALTVTPDGGRFSRQYAERLERQIADQVALATGISCVRVRCERSELVAGIQVADIVANSGTHARHDGANAEDVAKMLESRGIAMLDATFPLAKNKPGWLVA